MKILILGASGLVGSNIKNMLEDIGHDVIGTYNSYDERYAGDCTFIQYDVKDYMKLNNIVNDYLPEVVISSLRGDFEMQIRTHEKLAEYINADKKRKVFFISTLNVFDKDLSKTHFESDDTNPKSEYGIYKANCEKMLLQNIENLQVSILRIPSVWTSNCKRIKELHELEQTGSSMEIWTPVMHNYTTPARIGEAIIYILKHNLNGIFHLGSKDAMDFLEYYRTVASHLELSNVKFDVHKLEKIHYQTIESEREDFAKMNNYSVSDVLLEIGSV